MLTGNLALQPSSRPSPSSHLGLMLQDSGSSVTCDLALGEPRAACRFGLCVHLCCPRALRSHHGLNSLQLGFISKGCRGHPSPKGLELGLGNSWRGRDQRVRRGDAGQDAGVPELRAAPGRGHGLSTAREAPP